MDKIRYEIVLDKTRYVNNQRKINGILTRTAQRILRIDETMKAEWKEE